MMVLQGISDQCHSIDAHRLRSKLLSYIVHDKLYATNVESPADRQVVVNQKSFLSFHSLAKSFELGHVEGFIMRAGWLRWGFWLPCFQHIVSKICKISHRYPNVWSIVSEWLLLCFRGRLFSESNHFIIMILIKKPLLILFPRASSGGSHPPSFLPRLLKVISGAKCRI
jgi:hypothetical protein